MLAIGDRMKQNYENVSRFCLTRRMPVIIRVDGKAFHTFTRGCDRPFDSTLGDAMVATAVALLQEVQGAKWAYTQSDEISVVLTDYDTFSTEPWFGYVVQKMCSVSASIATASFNKAFNHRTDYKRNTQAMFDSRVFNIPREEVVNYFLWRQLDWFRNSVQMLAQFHFSQKQLHEKSQEDMKSMLLEKGIKWENLPDKWRNGTFVGRDCGEVVARNDWIVKDMRGFFESLLIPEEE